MRALSALGMQVVTLHLDYAARSLACQVEIEAAGFRRLRLAVRRVVWIEKAPARREPRRCQEADSQMERKETHGNVG
jgi:hypothetical protein